MVPHRYEEDTTLGKWVSTQRTVYDKKKVSRRRVHRLNSIGFVWKLQTQISWMYMFHWLVTYKEEHAGLTLVPQKYDKDPQLGHWVSHQREYLRNNKLPKYRVTLLKSIDFTLGTRAQREAKENNKWMSMYQSLVSYKEEHAGSTLVPQNKYDKDPQLGHWVSHQGEYLRNNKLPKYRVTLFKSIDFTFYTVYKGKKGSQGK